MPLDWINEDGTLSPGFESHLPPEIRDYAKDAKDVVSLIKRGADTQREFHSRVKLPTDLEDKRKFVGEHFPDVLEAEKTAREAAAQEEAKKAQAAAQEADEKRLTEARQRVTEMLGAESDGKLELCRRAFRDERCPAWVKDGVAAAAKVELKDISDETVLETIKSDPAVIQTLLMLGELTQDGRTVIGDGAAGGKTKMTKPAYPDGPALYKNRPDSDPEKAWFIAHGVDYTEMTWNGKPI